MRKRVRTVYLLFFIALALNVLFWSHARTVRAQWANVPPVPSRGGAVSMTAGDPQLAYRVIGVMLQNLGDSGGRTVSLKEYDYERLGQWFMLADSLDPRSDFVPMLAAFYYGATQEGRDLGPVIDYLQVASRHPYGQKWRWLAHAVYLARHGTENLDRALDLAQELAAMSRPGMPAWTRQMPALILTEQGDKQAAYDIMLGILKSGAETMDPAEIYYTREYMCTRLLEPQAARENPLCDGLPGIGDE